MMEPVQEMLAARWKYTLDGTPSQIFWLLLAFRHFSLTNPPPGIFGSLEETREPTGTLYECLENMGNSTQTVTWAQDHRIRRRHSGDVRRPRYPLPHCVTLQNSTKFSLISSKKWRTAPHNCCIRLRFYWLVVQLCRMQCCLVKPKPKNEWM